MHMTRTKLAPFCIILAGCLWGSMGLFVRRLGAMGLDSMEIVELRSLLAVALLFTVTAIRNPRQLKVTKRNLIPLGCSGVFSIIFFNYCYFSTIRVYVEDISVFFTLTVNTFAILHNQRSNPLRYFTNAERQKLIVSNRVKTK